MFAWQPGVPATHVAVVTNEDVVLPWGSGHHGHEPKGSWCVCVFVCVCGCSFEYSVLNLSRSRMLFKNKLKKKNTKKKTVVARKHKTISAFVLTLLFCCHLFISLSPSSLFPHTPLFQTCIYTHTHTSFKTCHCIRFILLFSACWLFGILFSAPTCCIR